MKIFIGINLNIINSADVKALIITKYNQGG